ncbi:hypothetical protein J3R82DRAFT_9794 [Butyriboletus roseoflavus]|nr:hypothetical protein J3R82DRAFT_9794 [Butyriboletus roseoflavus]
MAKPPRLLIREPIMIVLCRAHQLLSTSAFATLRNASCYLAFRTYSCFPILEMDIRGPSDCSRAPRCTSHVFWFIGAASCTGSLCHLYFQFRRLPKPPSHVLPPPYEEVVETVPLICSITPTSGTTGVPNSIVYPMPRSLAVLFEASSAHFKPTDGQQLRGGTVSVYLIILPN